MGEARKRMPVPVIMPKFEMAQESGKVLRWLKQEGEAVTKGEAILEVETDKVAMEVEAPASGTLVGIRVGPGARWCPSASPSPTSSCPGRSGRARRAHRRLPRRPAPRGRRRWRSGSPRPTGWIFRRCRAPAREDA
jgi:hypothetical protein